MTESLQQPNNRFALVIITILSAFFHVFMEWLFFVTKPSSLSTLSFYEKLKVLFISAGVYALVLLAVFIICLLPGIWKTRLAAFRFAPSALMLSIAALILIDNFTYTLFNFGIVTTSGAWRIIYTAIFIFIFIWMFRFVSRTAPTLKPSASALTLGMLAVSLTGILAIYSSRPSYLIGSEYRITSSARQPNIIILGADGLSANYLSVYGYKEDTTPFLSELAKTSLVAENALSNASSTTASTATALTSKEPAEVKVYRYPDVLSNEDSFEHLPGILKHQGYKTVEIGALYYVDAEQLNLLDGFDIVNGQSTSQPTLEALRSVLGNSPSAYFIQMTAERFSERLLHIFFLQTMQNPFKEVNNPKVRMTDAQRVDQIIGLLENSGQPVFVFSHFMDTHGPLFSSEKDAATDGSVSSEEEWDVSRYKDGIRSFDNHVRKIYEYLVRSGKLDNTILVIYTDHGFRYAVNQRIPIIIRFPRDEHAGVRKNNVEIMDIPVTLLDYLGISRPEWMKGLSILSEEPPAYRKIITITAGSPKKIVAPFYQIKIVQVTVCQKWYTLNVQDNIWKTGTLDKDTAPCFESTLPNEAMIHQMILDYLKDHGYDISSLQQK